MPTKPTVKLRLSPEMAGAETRVTNPVDVPAAPDTSAYDFESHSVSPETDLHSPSMSDGSMWESTRVNQPTAVTEAMPSNAGKLASKVQTAKNAPAQPARTIAQDVADVKLPDAPVRPLAGQGAMADKPVAKVIDRRGANVAKSRPAPAATEKVMTPEGSVEKVGSSEASVSDAMKSANRSYQPAEKMAERASTRAAYNESIGRGAGARAAEEGAGASLAAKAGPKLRAAGAWAAKMAGRVGEGLKSDLLEIDPSKPYRELQASRSAAKVAGEAAPGLMRGFAQDAGAMARGAGHGIKGAAEGLVLQATGMGTYNITKDLMQVHSDAAKNQNANVKQGAKYGLKVTNDTPWRAAGKSIAERFGMETDSSPKVEEDPALKAKFMAANKKRIQKIQGK